MKRFTLILLALVCLVAVLPAQQKFPNRPVECVIGWAAGGGADLVFRAIAAIFPKYANGQPMVIKNVPGAAGVPGIVDFAKERPDGYTILHWNVAHVIKTHMSKVPFTATQFTPVIQVVSAQNYLNVRADAKWKDLKEFVADAKKNPGKISVGNAGAGGGNHMAALLFERAAGIQLLHVPFTGGGPSVTGLLAGDVQSAMNIAPEGVNNVQAGQLRIMAVFGDKRLAGMPNVPTGKEQGVDLTLNQWRGVVCPPNTPAAVVKDLHDILKKCIEDPEFGSKMKALNTDVAYADGAAFGRTVAADDKRYEALCKELKLGDRYQQPGRRMAGAAASRGGSFCEREIWHGSICSRDWRSSPSR